MKKHSIYSYVRFDGVRCDLTPMLNDHSKEEVARIAGQQGRIHALRAAIYAFRNAGELDLMKDVLGMNGIVADVSLCEVTP